MAEVIEKREGSTSRTTTRFCDLKELVGHQSGQRNTFVVWSSAQTGREGSQMEEQRGGNMASEGGK